MGFWKKTKSIIKRILFIILKGKADYTKISILSGIAKGTRLRIDIRNESAYWLGTYDKTVLKRISRYIKPGQIVFDCGAYLGYYAAAMRNIVGNTGKVYLFEASPKNFMRVSELPVMNNWENVFVYKLAIGQEHSKIRFASNLGAASGPIDMPSKNMNLSMVDIEEVDCCGIDELIYEKNLPEPEFIKFDLETAEYYALLNGSKLWKSKKPIVLVELHKDINSKDPPTFKVAETFLKNFEYKAIEIHLNKPVANVEDFKEAERKGVQCTLLAVHKDFNFYMEVK